MPHGVSEHNRPNVSSIRSSDVGMFLQVTGTVIRTGTVCLESLTKVLYKIIQRETRLYVIVDQDAGVEENVRVR
jgi:DNA replicative helicase MCM subunit Mcm2 (Cdc46/Mcm family)